MNKTKQRNQQELAELLMERRWCYVIPLDSLIEGHGYRVSIAVTGEKGHFPTGNLDVLSRDSKVAQAAYRAGGTKPWFWGKTLEEARAACARQNEQALGLTPEEVSRIVLTTMG